MQLGYHLCHRTRVLPPPSNRRFMTKSQVVTKLKSHLQDRFLGALPSDGRSRHISAGSLSSLAPHSRPATTIKLPFSGHLICTAAYQHPASCGTSRDLKQTILSSVWWCAPVQLGYHRCHRIRVLPPPWVRVLIELEVGPQT